MQMTSRKPANWISTALASIQWLGFLFANTVVIPLSIGGAFHLSHAVVSGLMARSFIFTGIACLLQAWIGHGLPIMEGQSGFWWGIILNLANLGSATGTPLSVIGGSLAMGMVIGGGMLVVFALFGFHRWLNRLFTPMVMTVLLILLSAQLIDVFFKGALGLDNGSKVNPGIALLSLLLIVLVAGLSLFGKGLLSNLSILLGLAVGWLLFVLLIGKGSPEVVPSYAHIGQLFVLGRPAFQPAFLIAAVVAAVINMTNTVATLRAAESVFGRATSARKFKASFVLTSIFTALSGLFSLVPYAPYTSAIGFLRATRIVHRLPFIIASILFILLGAIPTLSGLMSTLPISVGDAVLFVAYLQIFGAALINLPKLEWDARNTFRLALPVLTGLAIFALPAGVLSTIPAFLQVLLGNGLLLGILLSLLLENTIHWDDVK
ncbi:uracil/xanthine transporter [Alicyclobacillus sp. SP_1]|uniref:uracil/xanthine transporter n=1 Tax=Alicyclobacillus sp. SP_1 TaxID=2942475 RepID=UPI002157B69F|nr:uracil/xanthine transporter [Alicyclobacillus sp. SP_1]